MLLLRVRNAKLLMMGTAETGDGATPHLGDTGATGSERAASATLVVADNDGRLPVVLLLGARRSAGRHMGTCPGEMAGTVA
jgi:hypothetical protein